MKSLFILPILLFVVVIGCKKDAEIVNPPSNSVGAIDKIYGVGFNTKTAIGWEVTSTAVSQFGVYRHSSPSFSLNSATRIGTVPIAQRSGWVDTGLVNNTTYYYTVVPELSGPDNSVIQGTSTKTVSLIPVDVTALSGSQIVYSQHVQPIFTKGCAIHGCHESAEHLKLSKQTHGGSDFGLSTWGDALSGTHDVAQIVPFRSSKSHMMHHLNDDTLVAPVAVPPMPPGFMFPIELRDLLIRWINSGAKNDDGTVAYSNMPARGWAYVTNQGEDLTAVIDLDKHKIARFITTGLENTFTAPPHAPHNVTVDLQNQFYYVNLIGASKLQKFRVSDNVKVGELSTGLVSPAQVALTKNGDTAFVSNFENSKTNITVINTGTMTKISDITSPAMLKPHGISITPDFRYVLSLNSLSDNISVISTADLSIVKTIPMSASVPALPIGYAFQYEPYQAVITPDNKTAFVTCRKSGEVRVVDLQTLTVVDSITVGKTPLIPAITPNGNYVFVANRNDSSVSAINTVTRSVEYTIRNVGVEPHGIAVSKDGKYLYVSCENLGASEAPHHATSGSKKPSFLKIIEIDKRAVVESLELGNFGSGMAVTH